MHSLIQLVRLHTINKCSTQRQFGHVVHAICRAFLTGVELSYGGFNRKRFPNLLKNQPEGIRGNHLWWPRWGAKIRPQAGRSTTMPGAGSPTAGPERRMTISCHVDHAGTSMPTSVRTSVAVQWLRNHPQIRVLNVAGNRESKNPGIGERVERFLTVVFKRANERSDT